MSANPVKDLQDHLVDTVSQDEGLLSPKRNESASAAGDDRLGSGRNLESILRIPVLVQVVLGSATMPVSNLMKLGRGAIIALDHRVGEPVEVVVNGRTIARGEVVVVEDDNSRFGVSLTEIVSLNADNHA